MNAYVCEYECVLCECLSVNVHACVCKFKCELYACVFSYVSVIVSAGRH